MLKYFVDDIEVSKDEFDERLEDAVSDYVDDNYDELLDECYEEVKIGCCTFSASEILKNCDPVAYRCGISDEVSYRLSEAQDEFESEYEDTIAHITFRTEEVEDEEE